MQAIIFYRKVTDPKKPHITYKYLITPEKRIPATIHRDGDFQRLEEVVHAV